LLDIHPDALRTRQCLHPSNCSFGAVTRTPNIQIGNKAQAGGMLYGLVRGAILAQPNRIMGEHMHHTLAHERSHTNSVTRIIRKCQKSPTKWNITSMQSYPIHNGSHTDLTYPIINMASKPYPLRAGTNGDCIGPVGQVRAR